MISSGHEAIEAIKRILRDVMHIDVATVDTDLIETGVLDSLALVELLFQVEHEFGLSIPLDDVGVESVRTIRGIGEMLARLDTPRRQQPA